MNGNVYAKRTLFYIFAVVATLIEIALAIEISIFYTNSDAVDATVSALDGTLIKSVYVDYSVGDAQYDRVFAGVFDFGRQIGDHVVINCRRGDPSKIRWKDESRMELILFGTLSVVFIALSLNDLTKNKRAEKQAEYLKKNGLKLRAEVIGIAVDFTVKRHGKYPYGMLECLYVDSADGHVDYFQSGRIAGKLDESRTYSIDVYRDVENKEKYFVDIDSLKDTGVKKEQKEDERE